MSLRFAALLGSLVLCLAACPAPTSAVDAGTDGGGAPDPVLGPCTGGCGPTQVCDTARHVCVDACGGCDAGVCTRSATGTTFECKVEETRCQGVSCGAGQTACVSGACSCLGFTRVARDTCAAEGRLCHETFNPVTLAGGTCESPRLYEECKLDNCPSGGCAACPSGQTCQSGIFGGSTATCLRNCPTGNANECNVDEFCDSNSKNCYPRSFFGGGSSCAISVPVDAGTFPDGGAMPSDGGFELAAVPAGNRCLLRGANGVATESTPSGNCSYSFFHLTSQLYPITNCRPPGTVALNGVCKTDLTAGTVATQCSTGLECAAVRGDTGLCLKTCNAAEPRNGITPTPACGSDEACVNLYRLEDPNSVLGVCMKTCNVFSANAQSCANYGSSAASCVPTSFNGRSTVTTDGAGVCIPQKASIAGAGDFCAETDPFKGAACGNGQICAPGAGSDKPTCSPACDTGCDAATPPARCATEPNAHCAPGKTCTKVTSASGATLGFCR